MSFLALPTSARASPAPSSASSPRKSGGNKKRTNPSSHNPNAQLDREDLDEADDVDENDLVAVPRRRAVDEEYDDDEEDQEADADAEVDDADGEGEEGGEEGPRRAGGGAMRSGANAAQISSERLKAQKERERANEIDRKGKKRRAETFMLREQLDPDQAKRFDTFSTVALNKNAIKRLNRDLYDQHCSPQVCMVVAGMAKIFIADVIELAKDLQPYSAHPTGPLQPYHLKLARLQLEENGLLASRARSAGLRGKKGIFRRR
ncbi:hypothetical protein IAU60_002814 [Kwoniella sp. DSM 27419]